MEIIEKMWEFLWHEAGVSDETLNIITKINGCNEDTMRDVLYVTTGYQDFDQIDEGFYGEEDEDDD